jgi:hypothetical protein
MKGELIRTIRYGERKLIWADEQPEEPEMITFLHKNTDGDSVHITLNADEFHSVDLTTFAGHTSITIRFPDRNDSHKFVEMVNNAQQFTDGKSNEN